MSNSFHIDPWQHLEVFPTVFHEGKVRIDNRTEHHIVIHIDVVEPPKPATVPMVIEMHIDAPPAARDELERLIAASAGHIAEARHGRVFGASSHLLPTPTPEDQPT